jgi:tetratricopeptide (TPR) repeat protein
VVSSEKPGWRRELERGAKLLKSGASDEARDCFARAHALAPDRAEPALALGRSEWRRGRLGVAEDLLRKACTAQPGWTLAEASLVRLLVERGALDQASRVLERARAAAPGDGALLAVEGELLLEVDRPEAALERFRAARRAGAPARVCDAGLARAENARGLELAETRRLEEAAFAFKRACDLDPRWAPPRVNLGALLMRLERPSAARAQLSKALALDPRNGSAHFNLAQLCRDQGDLADAERSFARALEADPPHPRARRELALVCADRGELERAVALLEEELRQARRPDPTVYANLGLAYAKLGNGTAAEAALGQALRLRPGHRAALQNLAAVYASQGRWLEAAALLRRVRQGNSDPRPASNE